jgi:hypothetical protein
MPASSESGTGAQFYSMCEVGMPENVNAPTEQCGACGAVVPAGSELCPDCGALLDAYRTPPVHDPIANSPVAAVPRPVVVQTPPSESAAPPREAGVDPALVDARRLLVRSLAEPKRELMAVLERHEVEEPAANDAVEPPQPERAPEPQIRQTIQRSGPTRPASNTRRVSQAPPSSPKRPGYVVRGTVEPIILIGVSLFLIACVVAAVGSLSGSATWLGIGLAIAAIGVIAVISAILVALVRHDRERG